MRNDSVFTSSGPVLPIRMPSREPKLAPSREPSSHLVQAPHNPVASSLPICGPHSSAGPIPLPIRGRFSFEGSPPFLSPSVGPDNIRGTFSVPLPIRGLW